MFVLTVVVNLWAGPSETWAYIYLSEAACEAAHKEVWSAYASKGRVVKSVETQCFQVLPTPVGGRN